MNMSPRKAPEAPTTEPAAPETAAVAEPETAAIPDPAATDPNGAPPDGDAPATVEAVDGDGNPVPVEVGADGIPVLPLAEDDGETIPVVMNIWISGLRNGQPWPQAGGEIALPVEEAEQYIALGYARAAE